MTDTDNECAKYGHTEEEYGDGSGLRCIVCRTVTKEPVLAQPQGWGEPWVTSKWNDAERTWHYYLRRADGLTIAETIWEERAEEYERAKVCVSALAGIANPEKLGELLATCQSVKRARRAMNADGGNPMLHLTYEATVGMMEVALAAIGALPAEGAKA